LAAADHNPRRRLVHGLVFPCRRIVGGWCDENEPAPSSTVFVIDADKPVRDAVSLLSQSVGLQVNAFASPHEFLETTLSAAQRGCERTKFVHTTPQHSSAIGPPCLTRFKHKLIRRILQVVLALWLPVLAPTEAGRCRLGSVQVLPPDL